MKQLAGFQRRFLRGRAHGLDPVVLVSEGGLSSGVRRAVQSALLDHELIKVRLQRPADKKTLAREIAEQAGAELCGIVGHTVILYRPHPEGPRLELPRRPA